jgi:hypothetical protein
VQRRQADVRTPPPIPLPQGEGGQRFHSFRHRSCTLLVVAILAASCIPALAADEDQDLQFIPQAAQQPPQAAPAVTTASGTQHNYLEDAFQETALRPNLLVPLPPPDPARWEDWLFLDSRDEWQLGDGVHFTYSGRFNFRAADNLPFPTHENVRNDLREAYVIWQPSDGTWLELGRINLKSGVALGYNPTDFFKTRAVVEPLTADPSVLREDRMGTLMVFGEHVWTGGSIAIAFAPQVTLPTAVYRDTELPDFDPMLDRTNAQDRFLLKGSVNLAPGLAPELLLYHAGDRTQIGANMTVGIGQQTVAYAEWAGGVRSDLITDALNYGRETGTLPPSTLAIIKGDPTEYFQNDLALGTSWSPAETKLTFNFEYHYHEAGFTSQDWQRWFNAARGGGFTGINSTLWYIRGYAQEQQEPLERHEAFVRMDWVDAFVTDLEITALANVSLEDGSGLVQATADYYVSRAWTVGVLGSFSFGGPRTDYGSLPQAGSVLLRVVRYL